MEITMKENFKEDVNMDQEKFISKVELFLKEYGFKIKPKGIVL